MDDTVEEVAFDLECTDVASKPEMTSPSTPEAPATYDDIPEIAKRRGSICLSMSFGQDAEGQPKNAKPAWLELASRFSGLYALLLIILGILFPLAETLQGEWLHSVYNTVFLVYIYIVGTVFVLVLQFGLFRKDGGLLDDDEVADEEEISAAALVRRTSQGLLVTMANDAADAAAASAASQSRRFLRRNSSTSGWSNQDGDSKECHDNCRSSRRESIISTMSDQLGDNPLINNNKINNNNNNNTDDDVDVFIDVTKLGFIFSHQGSSYFLRIGALIFSIGHLIYDILEIRDMFHAPMDCPSSRFWWIYIVRLIFLGVQTFVIFKNPSVHIKENRESLARLCFTHLIATNVCIWIRTLINETMVDFEHYGHNHPNVIYPPATSPDLNRTTLELDCRSRGVLSSLAVYLFPFILEYSLIAMGILMIIYTNMKEEKKNRVERGLKNLFKVDVFVSDTIFQSDHNKRLFAKSHRGIYLGFMFFGLTIISIVLFFAVLQDGSTNSDQDDLSYFISDLIIGTCLIVANVIAFVRLNPLSYIDKPCSVDDLLLLVAMTGSILFQVAVVMASASAVATSGFTRSTEVVRMCSALVGIVQTLIQVVQILNGLRRYPSKQEHVTDMPGRGALTFLVIGNISVWIFRTMQAKTMSLQDTQISFFGAMPWLLIMNTFLPFQLFYHFHASICLADVWQVAYKPLHRKRKGNFLESRTSISCVSSSPPPPYGNTA